MHIALDTSSLGDLFAVVSFATSPFYPNSWVVVHRVKSDVTDWCTPCGSSFFLWRFWQCTWGGILRSANH